MLDEFAAVAQTISFNPPRIPILSNLSGEPLTPEQATDPAYWVAQVREPVRFADGAAYLAAQGVTTCIELGPDGVLCAMAQGSFAAAEKDAVAVPLLRKDRAEATAMLGALAAAQANGAPLDWSRLLPRASPRPSSHLPLPAQALLAGTAGGGGRRPRRRAGQRRSPLLGAAISLPGAVDADGGWLLTGRLSLQTHPWLADHAVHGTAILPGTAFVEMALKAAEQVGAEAIEELTLEAPLVLPERGAVQVQVAVGALDENGSRAIAIHSRPEDGDDPERGWTTNAAGSLGAAADERPEGLAEWPPADAEELAIDSFYERPPRSGSTTAPPSRASGPPGVAARSSSPRSSWPRSKPPRPSASRSTRRCSTRPCTPAMLAEDPDERGAGALRLERRSPATGSGPRSCGCATRRWAQAAISLRIADAAGALGRRRRSRSFPVRSRPSGSMQLRAAGATRSSRSSGPSVRCPARVKGKPSRPSRSSSPPTPG